MFGYPQGIDAASRPELCAKDGNRLTVKESGGFFKPAFLTQTHCTTTMYGDERRATGETGNKVNKRMVNGRGEKKEQQLSAMKCIMRNVSKQLILQKQK